jgi:uncharacterized lipoprotein YddW (UPF0748 family)
VNIFPLYFAILLSVFLSFSVSADDGRILDDFYFTGDVDSGWAPMMTTPSPILSNDEIWGNIYGLKMPCDYSLIADGSRCYWDKSFTEDLSQYDAIKVRLFVSDITPIHRLTLYLQSTGGWFGYSVPELLLKNGWQTITINKSDFNQEGTPAGWHDITTIRLSPWKASGTTLSNYIAYDSIQAVSDAYVVDDFSYPNSESVVSEWISRSNSPAATYEASGAWGNDQGTLMPCDYSAIGSDQRCYWDRAVSLDLSNFNSISIRLYISDTAPSDRITFYFYSVAGWYSFTARDIVNGWQTIDIPRHLLRTEGDVGGLDNVSVIRVSPWVRPTEPGELPPTSNYIVYDRIIAHNEEISVVDDNWDVSRDDAAYFTDLLDHHDLNYVKLSPQHVINGDLTGSEIVVLPNVSVSPEMKVVLESYVALGGKIIAYGPNPLSGIASLLGIKAKPNTTAVAVTGLQFDQSVISALPLSQPEYSNYAKVVAEIDNSTVSPASTLAHWVDNDTGNIGEPAWLINANGAFSQRSIGSHNYHLQENAYFTSLVLSHFSDSVTQSLGKNMLNKLDHIGKYTSYQAANDEISVAATTLPAQEQSSVESQLNSAQISRDTAIDSEGVNRVIKAKESLNLLQQAYLATRAQSAADEYHAIWEHSGFGAYPGDWQKTISAIKSAGFNSLILNSARGGTAVYPSQYLEMDPAWIVDQHGTDPLQSAIDEAHGSNIELHYWKVFWNLSRSSASHISAMRAAGRTQVDINGNDIDWLTPCDDANRQLELDVIGEVINNYNVDGIHMDYIRFPGTGSYDEACKSKFELFIGEVFDNAQWPDVVAKDGRLEMEYRDWRADLITQVVADIHALIETVNNEQRVNKPNIILSAALIHRDDANLIVAQYWPDWISQGIIDQVHPMIYDANMDDFKTRVANASSIVAGRVPSYPGLGAWLTTSDKIASQIEWLRDNGYTGFTYFALGVDSADNRIDKLGRRILRKETQ